MENSIKLFLDTAKISEIREGISLGVFSGITTNPVILSGETKDYKQLISKILDLIPSNWELSLGVKAGNEDEMVKQAMILASWDKRIRVKLPTNSEGLKAARKLIEKIPLNMTIIKLFAQAILCQALAIENKPKDIILSLFCGRINQAGYEWKRVLKTIARVEWPGKILAASIKTPIDIEAAIMQGAKIVTAPLSVYQMALNSKLVQEDIDAFNKPFNNDKFRITKD